MKRRHHLEWYRFRKDRSPGWRRRRHRLENVGIRVAGTVCPTGASLVDLFNGRLVQNPSFVELANRNFALTKVVVHLTNNTSHNLFETGQLVLEVFQGVMENIYFGVLLPNYLTKVATLTKS